MSLLARKLNSFVQLTGIEHACLSEIQRAPDTSWRLLAERETWLFVVNGRVNAGPFALRKGDAVFADADDPDLRVGAEGVTVLVATKGPARVENLLRRSAARSGSALFLPAARFSPAPQ